MLSLWTYQPDRKAKEIGREDLGKPLYSRPHVWGVWDVDSPSPKDAPKLDVSGVRIV